MSEPLHRLMFVNYHCFRALPPTIVLIRQVELKTKTRLYKLITFRNYDCTRRVSVSRNLQPIQVGRDACIHVEPRHRTKH